MKRLIASLILVLASTGAAADDTNWGGGIGYKHIDPSSGDVWSLFLNFNQFDQYWGDVGPVWYGPGYYAPRRYYRPGHRHGYRPYNRGHGHAYGHRKHGGYWDRHQRMRREDYRRGHGDYRSGGHKGGGKGR